MNVLDYLNSKGVQYKHAGQNNVHTACFFHNEDPSKRGRLYINVDPNMTPPGLFKCHVCDEEGALNKIRKHFGDPPLNDDGSPFVGKTPGSKPALSTGNIAILKAACEFYEDKLVDNETAWNYLRDKRGLEVDTILRHRLGWAQGGLRKHLIGCGFTDGDIKASGLVRSDGTDFFFNRIIIPYLVNGHVVTLRGKDMDGKYQSMAGAAGMSRPYNVDSLRDATTAILTEGEFDAIILEQFGYATIGVPGASTWDDSWNGYLEDVKKIYTCFDRDDSGAKCFDRVSKSLGSKVRQILMPLHGPGETKNDPSEWIAVKGHTAEDFALLVSAANGSLVVDVNEAYQEWLGMEGNPIKNRMSLGFPNLDMIIDGGVQNGQVIVFLARTGVGKTITLVNMFHNIIADDPTKKILFFSLEQTRNEWFDRALKVYSFHNNPVAPKTIEELELWKRYSSERDARGRLKYSLAQFNVPSMIDFYQNNLMIVDRNKITEDEFRMCMEDFRETQGKYPDFVAVDYLGYWSRAFRGEGYERTTAAIMKLKELGKDYGVPICSPHQVNRSADDQRLSLTSGRDSGAIEETADFLFALQRDQQQEADTRSTGMIDVDINQLTIDVLKSRHGGKGSSVTLIDAPQSLTILQKNQGSDDNKRAERQIRGRKVGESLNDFYLRVAAGMTDSDFTDNWRERAFKRLENELRN